MCLQADHWARLKFGQEFAYRVFVLLNPNPLRDQYAQLLEQPDMITNLRLVCNPSDAEVSPVYCNSWQNHTAAFEVEDGTQPGPSQIDLDMQWWLCIIFAICYECCSFTSSSASHCFSSRVQTLLVLLGKCCLLKIYVGIGMLIGRNRAHGQTALAWFETQQQKKKGGLFKIKIKIPICIPFFLQFYISSHTNKQNQSNSPPPKNTHSKCLGNSRFYILQTIFRALISACWASGECSFFPDK